MRTTRASIACLAIALALLNAAPGAAETKRMAPFDFGFVCIDEANEQYPSIGPVPSGARRACTPDASAASGHLFITSGLVRAAPCTGCASASASGSSMSYAGVLIQAPAGPVTISAEQQGRSLGGYGYGCMSVTAADGTHRAYKCVPLDPPTPLSLRFTVERAETLRVSVFNGVTADRVGGTLCAPLCAGGAEVSSVVESITYSFS